MEFRKETIYFIVIDRFFNSCPGNDRVGRDGLFDPSRRQWGHYWGGDLRGVIEKAAYLQALGVSAIWLSPLFEQVDDLVGGHAPMHGYWTRDFKRINPHFIAPDDSNSLDRSRTLRQLVDTFHGLGIRLILDIVCNHSSPEINGGKGVVTDDGEPLARLARTRSFDRGVEGKQIGLLRDGADHLDDFGDLCALAAERVYLDLALARQVA
jgi:cyclomaltodextrin glucanotransferase